LQMDQMTTEGWLRSRLISHGTWPPARRSSARHRGGGGRGGWWAVGAVGVRRTYGLIGLHVCTPRIAGMSASWQWEQLAVGAVGAAGSGSSGSSGSGGGPPEVDLVELAVAVVLVPRDVPELVHRVEQRLPARHV